MSDLELGAAVRAALDCVSDPELDRSLLELGFAEAEVDESGEATVRIRLPTFWCAPNFAFLMAEDAREAVGAVPGVRSVQVHLLDHFADAEISSAMEGKRSFDAAFPGLVDGGGLDDLRRLFQVKAFTVWQERLLRRLLAEGRTPAEVARMELGEVDLDQLDCREYLERRRRLGLRTDSKSALAVLPNGTPLTDDSMPAYLRRARMTRVSMETNTALCCGLHATRYPERQEVMNR
jgi:metal-sulfur cluster biosynthetic enzyme